MKKYVFKPHNSIFPELFRKERERVVSYVKAALAIEHIGSTAIPGLGGKGIIDIAIAVNPQDMDLASKQLQTLGYEFRPTGSTADRLFFKIDLPDPEEEIRRYHAHLTALDSSDWKGFIAFRDHLRSHPKEVQEYTELKRRAATEANHDGEKYRKIKEPMFLKISRDSRETPHLPESNCMKKFPLSIHKVSLADCHEATGLVIVIDVLRAFTTAAYAFGSGAKEILLVSTVEEAFALKQKDPSLLLMGESQGQVIPGFDFGNSPVEIARADLRDKRLVQRTSAGTQGVIRARKAEHMFTSSFSVAEATFQQILKMAPEKVTFVITGTDSGDEDLALADYLEQKLQGGPTDPAPYLKRVVDAPEVWIFSEPYLKDVQTAIRIDHFPFAMQVFEGNILRPIGNR